MTAPGGKETQEDAECDISDGEQEFCTSEHQETFVHKGTEGGESATEACDEQQLEGGIAHRQQMREQTYQETTYHIGSKCTQRICTIKP